MKWNKQKAITLFQTGCASLEVLTSTEPCSDYIWLLFFVFFSVYGIYFLIKNYLFLIGG